MSDENKPPMIRKFELEECKLYADPDDPQIQHVKAKFFVQFGTVWVSLNLVWVDDKDLGEFYTSQVDGKPCPVPYDAKPLINDKEVRWALEGDNIHFADIVLDFIVYVKSEKMEEFKRRNGVPLTFTLRVRTDRGNVEDWCPTFTVEHSGLV